MPSILISHLELSALAGIAIVLHAFRRSIGQAPLYLMLGMYYIVALLADSPQLYHGVLSQGMFKGLGYGMMWLPFLLMLILIYELEGTLAAHRFLLGLFLLLICFFCLSLVIFGNIDQSISQKMAKFEFEIFYNLSNGLILCFIGHLGACIILPVVYQSLRNRNIFFCIAVFVSFCVFMVINEAILSLYVHFTGPRPKQEVLTFFNWNMRLLSMGWLSILGQAYLFFTRTEVKTRKTFGFVSDIFAYFQSTERMRRSLAEWSGRYQLVVDNSSELVFLLDQQGKVLNANSTALRWLGNRLLDADFLLPEHIRNEDGAAMDWQKTWAKLDFTETDPPQVTLLQNLFLELPDSKLLDIDVNLSSARLDNDQVALMIARDMTVQHEEARRRQNIAEQTMHSQRLESIGQLAGGIAHDFNNLLHSIQANIETLQERCKPDFNDRYLLDNVAAACHRASLLTSQLLGFARKGKFNESVIDVSQLLEKVEQLFRPTAKNVSFRIITSPDSMQIRGDENQLTQVLLNLLLNSRDALEDIPGEKKIVLRAEVARSEMTDWEYRPDRKATAEAYVCIRVRDNGCGMSEQVKMQMFDPFFTTKPTGKGTGMGLSMVYGCIMHHHGWLHVTSEPGQGCDVAVFLPRLDAKEVARLLFPSEEKEDMQGV